MAGERAAHAERHEPVITEPVITMPDKPKSTFESGMDVEISPASQPPSPAVPTADRQITRLHLHHKIFTFFQIDRKARFECL